jgi:hypothetical protein
VKPLAPNCRHIGTCAEADAAVAAFAKRQGFSWRTATHNDLSAPEPSVATACPVVTDDAAKRTASGPARVFSASAIELADDRVPERGGCRRAWAHRYVDGLRKPEMTWEQVLAWEEWAKVHGYWSEPSANSGIVKPVAGQRSASLGTRTHLYAQWYLTGAATADADVYGPRRLIDWESLPGQVLQSMLPLLPPAGSVAPELAEAEFELEVGGVKFRGVIDLLLDEVWDHKTTRDIRGYALLPDVLAQKLGAPERSIKSNLQSCIYSVRHARQTDPPADATTCRWTYGETDLSRRALQVVQEIPYTHALGVVERAADVARTLTYPTSDAAPPNTLACDKYGGCWYRGQPCTVRRDYGRIALLLEKEETEMTEKKMSFAELQKACGEQARCRREARRHERGRQPRRRRGEAEVHAEEGGEAGARSRARARRDARRRGAGRRAERSPRRPGWRRHRGAGHGRARRGAGPERRSRSAVRRDRQLIHALVTDANVLKDRHKHVHSRGSPDL